MPEFRFSAVDSSGQAKSGKIEAASKSEATARLVKKGWQVTELVS